QSKLVLSTRFADTKEDVMTAVLPPRGTVRTLTLPEAREELGRLEAESGMSIAALKERGDVWDLDAHERGLLAEIRNLEFLIDRATR
ncbi:hypothetical protein, partial [Streptomyces sp. NPDC127092]|uniref:hypothetical protein n=1 Tax=Streptomyces sp. NPDC127092 TaxID=3347135 RepID=UPI0036646199